MDIKKQKLLLEYLISSVDTFALTSSIIRPEYFDPELRNTVAFIEQYYDQYNTTPDVSQIAAESGVDLTIQAVSRDKIDYCANEIEAFCKRKAIERAILSSPALIEKGDYGQVEKVIKEAITVSLNRDLGMRYFDDPLGRLRRLTQSETPHATRWIEFDQMLNGGILRKQMLLFSANSGGGKSMVMANLAVNFIEDGLRVLYITLELSEEMVSLRFDSMITGVHAAEWRQRITETATKIESKKDGCGELYIKYMSAGTTSNQIRAYLKEFELKYDCVPDMLIVDYLDIMGTNEKMYADNVFEKDKQTSEQLRNIGADYNMFVVTASQQNRGAVGVTDLNHSHIAGGISKINTTDVYVSIIMTDAMKASGELAMQFLKTRSSDGVGKTIYMKWDNKALRVSNPDQKGNRLVLQKGTRSFTSEDSDDGIPDGKGLLDLISITQ